MSKYEFCKTCSYWKDGICKCPNNNIICSETPTVDAIPVEWIKKYIENHTYEMVNPKYVDDTYNYIKFTKEPLDYNLIVTPIQVKAMLEDWEKENGLS